MPSIQFNILAIPGSLRRNSSAMAVLRQIGELMPPHVNFVPFTGLGQIPHFDDSDHVPEEVVLFRKKLAEADGILIVTPEYAFGVPGTLKNSLDWTVSSGELVNKPMALVTASSQGEKGHAALLLTLSALSAKINSGTSLLIPFVRSKLDEQGKVKDLTTLNSLKTLVDVFVHSIAESKIV